MLENDNRTVSKLLEDYKSGKVENDLMNDFFYETARALAFVKASTIVRLERNKGFTGFECVSLIDDYAENIVLLTGGFNQEFIKELNKALPFDSKKMTYSQYESGSKAPYQLMPEISDAIDKHENDLIKVKDVVFAASEINTHAAMLSEYVRFVSGNYYDSVIDNANEAIKLADDGLVSLKSLAIEGNKNIAISMEDVTTVINSNQPINVATAQLKLSILQSEAISALAAAECTNLAEAQKILKQEDIPVEIVESFDGYVLNTNQPITARNQGEFDRKVENGNEVIHNEPPMETTIHPSEAKGRVKLESFDDIGSVEKAEGVPTYEEREEKTENKKKQAEREKE